MRSQAAVVNSCPHHGGLRAPGSPCLRRSELMLEEGHCGLAPLSRPQGRHSVPRPGPEPVSGVGGGGLLSLPPTKCPEENRPKSTLYSYFSSERCNLLQYLGDPEQFLHLYESDSNAYSIEYCDNQMRHSTKRHLMTPFHLEQFQLLLSPWPLTDLVLCHQLPPTLSLQHFSLYPAADSNCSSFSPISGPQFCQIYIYEVLKEHLRHTQRSSKTCRFRFLESAARMHWGGGRGDTKKRFTQHFGQ